MGARTGLLLLALAALPYEIGDLASTTHNYIHYIKTHDDARK
jgi:hypothetical protein